MYTLNETFFIIFFTQVVFIYTLKGANVGTYYLLLPTFYLCISIFKAAKNRSSKTFCTIFQKQKKCTHTYTYDFSSNSNFISLNVGGVVESLFWKKKSNQYHHILAANALPSNHQLDIPFFNQKNIFLKINRKHQLNDCSLVMQVWRLHGWMCKYF